MRTFLKQLHLVKFAAYFSLNVTSCWFFKVCGVRTARLFGHGRVSFPFSAAGGSSAPLFGFNRASDSQLVLFSIRWRSSLAIMSVCQSFNNLQSVSKSLRRPCFVFKLLLLLLYINLRSTYVVAHCSVYFLPTARDSRSVFTLSNFDISLCRNFFSMGEKKKSDIWMVRVFAFAPKGQFVYIWIYQYTYF